MNGSTKMFEENGHKIFICKSLPIDIARHE